MEKYRTTVKIAGKEYNITSHDKPEYTRKIAAIVDKRMTELSYTTKLPPAQLSILVALNSTEDMLASREEVRRLRLEIEALREELEKRNAQET